MLQESSLESSEPRKVSREVTERRLLLVRLVTELLLPALLRVTLGESAASATEFLRLVLGVLNAFLLISRNPSAKIRRLVNFSICALSLVASTVSFKSK